MAIDSGVFRKIIGNFATGVTVVTTANDGFLHGLTANSVTSVSLDPLLLLVCVDKKAHAHTELERCSHFGVSILGADQVEVSNLFARPGEPEQGSLRGAAWHYGPGGTPLLDGALAWLECRLAERLAGGDHTIFIGEATGGEVTRPQAPPLLYFRGGYRGVAS
ncbi:MAG: flavin reductase family protein [Deltaproteobacteria bacterium]|nr:flavin reductase family protein [Deltaproteobacteria bacterium]